MPRNAMTAGQQRQDVWLQAWQQRQKQNNPGYNASWMPKEGWRGRFNQWQRANSQPHNPGQPQPPPGTPRVPANTPGVPYAPPPPTPAWTPGWRTLAPVGVPEGGWGGGAIEHETAPSPGLEPANPNPPPGMEVIGGSGHNWIYGPKRPGKGIISPGTPIQPSVSAAGMQARAVTPAPQSWSSFAGYSAPVAPVGLWSAPASQQSRRALNPASQDWSGFGGYGTAPPRNPNDPWSAPGGQQPRRTGGNAMNQYKGSVNWSQPGAMGEY